jgi:hypothetical protein
MHRLAPLIALLTAAGLGACGDTTTEPNNGTAGGGGTGGGGPVGCDTDYARISADPAPVSLEDDLMPIFQRACTLSQCHCNRDTSSRCTTPVPKSELFLGAPASEGPVADYIADVHADLVNVESTTAAGVMRVVPGDPGASFLIQKLSDTHADMGHDCTPQDPTTTGCGDPMPPGGATLCTTGANGQAEFELFARWVAQGALNN